MINTRYAPATVLSRLIATPFRTQVSFDGSEYVKIAGFMTSSEAKQALETLSTIHRHGTISVTKSGTCSHRHFDVLFDGLPARNWPEFHVRPFRHLSHGAWISVKEKGFGHLSLVPLPPHMLHQPLQSRNMHHQDSNRDSVWPSETYRGSSFYRSHDSSLNEWWGAELHLPVTVKSGNRYANSQCTSGFSSTVPYCSVTASWKHAPLVRSVEPHAGMAGDIVQLQGERFPVDDPELVVTFEGTSCEILHHNSSSIMCMLHRHPAGLSWPSVHSILVGNSVAFYNEHYFTFGIGKFVSATATGFVYVLFSWSRISLHVTNCIWRIWWSISSPFN